MDGVNTGRSVAGPLFVVLAATVSGTYVESD